MIAAEWGRLASAMQGYWPNRKLEKATLDLWFRDLADLPAEEVSAGLSALARDGREFAPTGGQIRAKVEELRGAGELDHGAAWRLAMDAVRGWGSAQESEALEWLAERSATTAEAVRRFGYRDLCLCDLDELGTVRAQFREIFNAVKRAAERDERYSGLPAVGPKRLEPRPIRELVVDVKRLEPGP